MLNPDAMEPTMKRRVFLAATAITAATLAAPALAQKRTKPFRMVLNTSFSGPQSFLLLAQDRGYLAKEGIEIEFTQGGGAYTAAPRMFASDFDFGYGDINSLIEVAAEHPQKAPVGIFALFNASPSTIALKAAGPIQTPKDLEGKTLLGHSSDVALKTFPAFCKVNGVDASKVTIQTFGGGMRAQVETMLGSNSVHGVFGYVSTIASAMAEGGRDLNDRLRHLRFAEYVSDLYGSTLMVSRKVLKENRTEIAGVVRAFNRGLVAAVQDPEAGIDAVMRRAAWNDRPAEMLRLKTTYEIEMAHPDGKRIGIGAVDDARLTRAIALIAETNRLKRRPALDEIFMSDFLPPLADRVRSPAS
jgi:NitT/TauT family transport system substrate-binding protein